MQDESNRNHYPCFEIKGCEKILSVIVVLWSIWTPKADMSLGLLFNGAFSLVSDQREFIRMRIVPLSG